jgi:hypothetical protein
MSQNGAQGAGGKQKPAPMGGIYEIIGNGQLIDSGKVLRRGDLVELAPEDAKRIIKANPGLLRRPD